MARLVLRAGAAKKFKDPLMVLWIDAAPVVGDLEYRKTELRSAADCDLAGGTRLEILEPVVDQVRENLLECEAIADEVRERLDPNPGLRLRGLMRERGDNGFDQFTGVD